MCSLIIHKKNRRLGPHITFQRSLFETIESLPRIKCYCTQFFIPILSTKSKNLNLIDKELTKNYCLQHNLTFYVHCPFRCNLANPKSENIELLKHQLKHIEGLPASGVLHVGRVGTLDTVISMLNSLEIPNSSFKHPHLLLENAAGQGTELGWNWDQLRKIWESVDIANRIGLCIDTQHAFASGLCDFTSSDSVIKLFEEAAEICPITLFHLNDSKKPFKSRVDRHEAIGEGYIWSQNRDSLKMLFQLCEDTHTDIVLETPGNQWQQILNLRREYFT